MNSLRGVVRRLADSGSVVGMRDYALVLFYFLTGLRWSEVIGLKGKDLEVREGALVIKCRRKGVKFTAREVSEPEPEVIREGGRARFTSTSTRPGSERLGQKLKARGPTSFVGILASADRLRVALPLDTPAY